RGGGAMADPASRGAGTLGSAFPRCQHFRRRLRRLFLVPGGPAGGHTCAAGNPQGSAERGVPVTGQSVSAGVRRAAAHGLEHRRRMASSPPAADLLRHHVHRRHLLVPREGARLLPAWRRAGCHLPRLLSPSGSRRARADAGGCGGRARGIAHLRRPGAIAALRGDGGSVSGAHLSESRRPRWPGDTDDRHRVRTHAAAHVPSGGGAAHDRGALRVAGRKRLRRDHDRRHDGMMRFASPAATRTLGLKPEEITGKRLAELWDGEDGERLQSFLTEIAATPSGAVGPVELRIERASRVVEAVGSNLSDDPAVRGFALNFRDISERKVLEEKLRELAFHDPLTLLANSNIFRDRVQHALTRARRGEKCPAVMFLDVDNFKNINDSLGHDAGDRLLQAVAQRIIHTSRASDTVARLGGDEFGVLLEGAATAAEVQRVADALVESLGVPFSLDGREVRVTASVGVAFSAAETTAKELLSNADLAMYHAKSAGKNCHVTFQPQMQTLLHERLRLEADMERALSREEFFLEYQPIVDLGTRVLLGVEALVRWRHPESGVLMPASFIHVLEECGQIVPLGRWVLKQACRDVCAWRRSIAGGAGLRLAVNISARHLQQGDLIQDVREALETSGLEPANLVIELTESTLMYNSEVNLERFHHLKALGVKVAIDDFGTGYSSLSYLHRFPIDILKIDRSFVNGLTSADDSPELARAVITLGETLGLDTVAEGIELEPQVAALLGLGCVAGQGFLFAKACSLEQLSKSPFVDRRNELWTAQAVREQLSPTGRFKALRGNS